MFQSIWEKGVIVSEFLLGTPPLKTNFPRRNRIISGLSKKLVVIEATEKSGSLITARYALDQSKEVIVVPGSMFYEGAKGSNRLLIEKKCLCCSDVEEFKRILELDHIHVEPIKSTPHKQEIIELLSNTPTHIDKILEKSTINKGKLYALLFEMQMKNEIICLPGNYYVKAV